MKVMGHILMIWFGGGTEIPRIFLYGAKVHKSIVREKIKQCERDTMF